MTDTSSTVSPEDDEDTAAEPRAGAGQPHNASGLMPAQNDATVAEVAPDRVADTDAFGRTPDER